MKKQYALVLIAVIVLSLCVSAAYARVARGDKADEICIPKPTGAFSLAMVTESAAFLFAGGVGPLMILLLVVAIAVILTHVLWSGF